MFSELGRWVTSGTDSTKHAGRQLLLAGPWRADRACSNRRGEKGRLISMENLCRKALKYGLCTDCSARKKKMGKKKQYKTHQRKSYGKAIWVRYFLGVKLRSVCVKQNSKKTDLIMEGEFCHLLFGSMLPILCLKCIEKCYFSLTSQQWGG